MKKRTLLFVYVLAFFVFFVFTSILIATILKCINNFIDFSFVVWFERGLISSGIISVIASVAIVHYARSNKETKLSFWFGKNYPKLLFGYVLIVLALASIKSQPVWPSEMVSEVLSIQWTIFGLSLTIFLVWNVIMVEFLKNKQPKLSDFSDLFQKYTLALEKRMFLQETETTFSTAILLTINLFLLLISTSLVYVNMKPESIITQNILLCSFFFTGNSILCLFMDILRPLKKDKTELQKNNDVTKEDIDKAQAAKFAQAIINGIKEGVMSLDPEVFTEDEKTELLVKCLESLRNSVNKKNYKTDN